LAVPADVRGDVHEDQAGQPLAVVCRIGQGVEPAQRLADEDRAIEAELLNEPLQIAYVVLGVVLHRGRPLAVAVAALIEREAAEVPPECEADDVPGVGGQGAAVEEHDVPAASAPVEVVEA
jgi:hypothetical protein